jgi:hypothetical protein
MIIVKMTNGVVGWVTAREAALACYEAGATALQGWGKIWIPGCRAREAGPAIKWIKEDIECIKLCFKRKYETHG